MKFIHLKFKSMFYRRILATLLCDILLSKFKIHKIMKIAAPHVCEKVMCILVSAYCN